jgi:hypothetical protein
MKRRALITMVGGAATRVGGGKAEMPALFSGQAYQTRVGSQLTRKDKKLSAQA